MDNYVGEIRLFAGPFAPRGWAFCDGSFLEISQYDTLFSLIQTTYGGDGVRNFALPDLRGRVPIHQTTDFPLGTMGGKEQVTLTKDQLPVHTHQVKASSSTNADSPTPANAFWASSSGEMCWGAAPGSAIMNSDSTQHNGGNLPHENRIPMLVCTYIIALEGIYPSKP